MSRENLDPFDEHEDEECLAALRRVHLIADNMDVSSALSMHFWTSPKTVTANDSEGVIVQSEYHTPLIDLDTKVHFLLPQRNLLLTNIIGLCFRLKLFSRPAPAHIHGSRTSPPHCHSHF